MTSCKTDLEIDHAWLNITNAAHFGIKLFTQATECDKCSLQLKKSIPPHDSQLLNVSTTFPTILKIYKRNAFTEEPVCSEQYHFGEYGEYILNVEQSENESVACNLQIVTGPINSNLYVLWAFLLFLGLSILWLIGIIVYRKKIKKTEEDESLLVSDLGSPSERGSGSQIWSFAVEPNVARLRERLKSLDTFRGICIIVMIFVNYGGGQYWFFHHAAWNGLTVADLVFPWFMWIMGTSIALSLQSQIRKAIPKMKIFLKIFRRSVVLFCLGLILNSKYGLGCELSRMRIFGVLQRFGITYFVVATLQLLSEKTDSAYQVSGASLRDILPYWPHWLFMSLIVTAHSLITLKFPVPGCPTGYLGPGGTHLNSSYQNCTGGAAGYIDRLVLGENHMYRTPSCKQLYDTTVPFDPEGILGYLTAIFTVFLGLQAGKIITMYQLPTELIKRWMIWAVITGAFGTLLCQASQNDGWIPVNKNLWSLSYVFATSSMAFILLTICYIFVDMFKWWSGAPFLYPGMNAITLYIGHTITEKWFPWDIPAANTHVIQLSLDIWGTFLWIIFSIWLYFCNIFVAV